MIHSTTMPNGTALSQPASPATSTSPVSNPPPVTISVPASASSIKPIFSNESNGEPIGLGEMCAYMFDLTKGWPCSVAGSLCVPVWDPATGRFRVDYVVKAPRLIACLDEFAQVSWSKKRGCYDKAEFYQAVQRRAPRRGWVTEFFHVPVPADVLYVNRLPVPIKTGYLDQLVSMFVPHTNEDRILIKSFFITLFWGGPPGKRPLFVFATGGPGRDPSAGRGSGKSTVTHVGSRLCGGLVSISRRQDWNRLTSDLLSPHGLGVRLVVFDNAKGFKVSSAELESMITAPVIDGHVNYVGHGSRPNYLTYALTANEPVLSTDLASRAIPIEVRPSRKSAAWDEQLEAMLGDRAFMDGLYADIAWYLVQSTDGYADDPDDRWPLWWKNVGFRACRRPEVLSGVRNLVKERRGDVDGDQSRRDAITNALKEMLQQSGISDADRVVVFFPTAMLASRLVPVLATAIGKLVSVSEAEKWLGTLRPEHLYKEKNGPAEAGRSRPRGYWWIGASCDPTGLVPAFRFWESVPGSFSFQRLDDGEGARILQKLQPALTSNSDRTGR